MSETKWYLSYEMVVFELDPPNEQHEFEDWENHILIRADSPEEAYEKALKHGSGESEPVTIDGKKGRSRFIGLKNLVKIYDELEDGAEIDFRKLVVTRESINHLVKPKESFHAFQKEIDKIEFIELEPANAQRVPR